MTESAHLKPTVRAGALRISCRMGKMTLIRPADMADVGTMNGHQRFLAALLWTIPTGRPVNWAARGAVQSRDLRRSMPPIPDGILTNECISVRIPATPAKTTDA